MRHAAVMNAQLRLITAMLPIAGVLLSCAACKPQEGISTYSVERTSAPKEPFVAAKVTDQLDRILAAMLPIGDQVYFFKLAGKAPGVERHREEFDAFIASIDKAESANSPLSWKLPNGWSEKGASEMRINTIVIPDEEADLEIAISSLPLAGTWEEFVAMNANRWLGQLSQGELARQTIINLTTENQTKAGTATIIQLAGVLKDASPMNPHAGFGDNQQTASRSAADTASPPVSGSNGLEFDTPQGWQPGQVGGMRKAAFVVTDGEEQGEFTAIDLPTAGGPQVTDVMANVQRWAVQVGASEDNLAELVREIEIAGTKGSVVKLVGPEGPARKAMLAALVVHGDKVWFFKLAGDAALVEREEDSFNKFLDSVRFK